MSLKNAMVTKIRVLYSTFGSSFLVKKKIRQRNKKAKLTTLQHKFQSTLAVGQSCSFVTKKERREIHSTLPKNGYIYANNHRHLSIQLDKIPHKKPIAMDKNGDIYANNHRHLSISVCELLHRILVIAICVFVVSDDNLIHLQNHITCLFIDQQALI